MQLNWGLLANAPDVGQSVMAGFERGQAMGKQRRTENALAAYAQNPDDARSLNALIQADPMLGMQAREQQTRQMEARREKEIAAQRQRTELFGRAAALADTPQEWDAMIDHLAPQYPEVAQYKGKFDPAMRDALMAQAGVTPPQDRQTALQQNYEFLKSRNPQLAEEYLRRQASEPPMIASNGNGTYTIIPRSQFAPPAPSQADPPPAAIDYLRANPNLANDFDAKYGPGTAARILGDGGAAATPPPTFPE